MNAVRAALLALAGALLCGPLASQEVVDGFAARSFTGAAGLTMPYRIFVPAAEARTRPLPLIVYLHGGGGLGTDNVKQISRGNTNGTHVWTTARMQSRHPSYVVAPQLPPAHVWGATDSPELAPYGALVVELIGELVRQGGVDADRVYLTGQSLGGQGTWDLASKRSDLFAAAVPLCGIGNPARVAHMRHLPVWVFHGALDASVPVARSREMVAALRAVGSPVKYTEYPDVSHDAWSRAYVDPELQDWLFAQARTATPRSPGAAAAKQPLRTGAAVALPLRLK